MKNGLKVSTIAIVAGLLLTLPASAVSINLGGNGNGGLLGGGDGGSSNPAISAQTNGLLDNGSTDGTATVNLGGTGGTNGNVLLDLFGSGSNNATADIGLGGVGTGGGNDAVIDLFGNDGSDGAGGANGTNGSNGSNGPGGIGGAGARTVGTVQIASIDAKASARCFSPNADQMAKLVNRHDYVDATFATWAGVSQIKVVDVGLCDTAGSSISSQGNIGRLQSYISDHPSLNDGLSKLGHTSSDVVGVDKSDKTLVVYVM